ncbi:DUF1361 domain-containing protein [Secundilactobacillus similis DSM 23365 = JCM 2765]|uniref:DUF1361 domain-containing protein n=1 Tax=Secundilactobacillus similis DSM 23365 = JCM 2765 TaxID=1423804 RepID=A0A0R2EVG4_9LACO|nr:DUF1361 domain-containing protein [Secundilactobacillus similis]KRN20329.1 hypothetical protein FD14_GL001487 [Secundilactobacillus similis DSM 23365 = JCM 2765]
MKISARWQIRGFVVLWLLFLWGFVKAPFTFLILNTFLGYLPIEFSFHIHRDKPKNGLLFWALVILWLLFYPNAPYLLTDLFHLSLLNPYGYDGLLRLSLHMWVYFTLVLISALFCVILGFWSLNYVAGTITERYLHGNHWLQAVLVLILTFLSSVGIYAGRFLRIHTVYLFISPEIITQRLIHMWTPTMLVFVGLMTVIQLVAYWLSHLVYRQQLDRTLK